jgi:hypothetical protein
MVRRGDKPLPPVASPGIDLLPAEERALSGAETAIKRLGRASSQRGFETSLTLAAVAAQELEKAIDKARRAGVSDISALETQSDRLRQSIQDGTAQAGTFRAAQKDVSDELKRSTTGAGEFQGQLGGIDQILGQINPKLGNMAGNALAVGGALAIVQGAGRELATGVSDLALSLGATQEFANSLGSRIETAFSINPIKVFSASLREADSAQEKFFGNLAEKYVEITAAGDELLNLQRLLAREGFEVIGKSVEQLRGEYERLRTEGKLQVQVQQDIHAAGQAFADQVEGNTERLRTRNKELADGIAIAEKDGEVSYQAARLIVTALDEQLAALRRNGEESDPLLERKRAQYVAIAEAGEAAAKAAQELADREKRIEESAAGLSAAWEGNAARLDERTEAVRRSVAQVEQDGVVTAAAGAALLKDIDAQIKAYELLGQEAPADLRRLAGEYRGIEAAARAADLAAQGLSETSRQKLGVQTPAAIRENITALKEYEAEVIRGGELTKEAAEKLAQDYRQRLVDISLLTAAEREAMGEEVAFLRERSSYYAKYAEDRKSFARDAAAEERKLAAEVAEAEKKALEERAEQQQKYVESLASALEQIRSDIAAATPPGPDTSALQKELVELQKKRRDSAVLTQEELTRLDELETQYRDTGAATRDLTKEIAGLGDANTEAVVSSERVSTALNGVVDTIRNAPEAFQKLDQSSREALGNIADGLQATADSGRATQQAVDDAFSQMANVLEGAGVDASFLRAEISKAGGSAESFSKQLSNISNGLDPMTKKLKKLSDEEKGIAKISETTKGWATNMQVVAQQSARALGIITQISKVQL